MKKYRQPGKAVVLLSGGLDSATVLAIAKSKGHDLYAITFDYHQRHNRELDSARMIASSLSVEKHLIVNFNLRDIGGSALTSDMSVPKGGIRLQGAGSRNRTAAGCQPMIPITYVPARNTIFLSFALGWAEVLGADTVYIGANAVDYSGYPDCRPEYLRAFERMANLATKASVEKKLRFHIRAPLIDMSKAEIIRKGVDLGFDYSLTWSCYDPACRIRRSTASHQPAKGMKSASVSDGTGQIVPCGKCDSCRLRAKGFREAGIRDPLLSR